MSLTLAKQNAYRQRYAQWTRGWYPATEVYETVIRRDLVEGMRVLDMGCGRGGVLEQLGSAVTHPVGIDPDWQSLEEHRLPHLPRATAIADALPFMDACFDRVVCSWVLEHLPNPAHTFSEVARVLKPNGYFITITPNKNSLVVLLNRLVKPLQHKLVPRLYGREEADTFPVVYRANTVRTLTRLAQNANLNLAEVRRIKDPTYLAFHPALFYANVGISRVLPSSMAEHLVAIVHKPA